MGIYRRGIALGAAAGGVSLFGVVLAMWLWLVPAPGALGATPAPPAPKAPGVNTGTPQTSPTSVTFKGSVNPHGLATVYAFQFGTTTGYGAQTAPAPAGNGTTSLPVSQTMTGLTPGVTYHCRLIATNSVGTTNGRDVAFTIKVPLKLELTASPNPVVFGSPLTVSGTLAGTGNAGRQVQLQSSPFPYLSGFKTIAGPMPTSASGSFSFGLAGLTENTQLKVLTLAVPGSPATPSRTIAERVAPRVSLHLRSSGRPGFVRMYGTVAPALPGGRVGLQLIRRGAKPRWIASAPLKRAGIGESRFSRVVRIRGAGLYRVFVPVTTGKLVAGHSRPLLIR